MPGSTTGSNDGSVLSSSQTSTIQPSSSIQTQIPDSHSSQRPSVFKSKAMLKLWPQQDQTTPKARPQDQNPFDDPRLTTASNAAFPPSSITAPAPRTPTGGSFQQHRLLHPSSSSTSFSNPTTPIGPGLSPPVVQTISSAFSADVTSPGPTAKSIIPTPQVSLHAPVFNMQQPPFRHSTVKQESSAPLKKSSLSNSSTSQQSSASTDSTSSQVISPSSSKGQLHMKLISASHLNVSSYRSRPYVVVQYDNNEFVSREPILETEKEARGSPLPTSKDRTPLGPGVLSRNSSTTALSTLSAININGNKKPAKGVNGSNTSPSSSVGSSGSQQGQPSNSTTQERKGSSSTHPAGLFGGISPSNPVWKHQVSFDVTSDSSVITLNIYDRSVDENSTTSGFLGMLEIKPVLIHDHSVDNWYQLKPHENEKVTGTIRVQTTYEQYKTRRSLTPRDFEFLKLIGKGTFGRVFQVRKKDTKRIYAMKVLSKREIVAKKEIAHTIGERKILQKSLESPFLVGLKFSFQTDTDLYLVTDFKSGGELFWHLQRDTRFSEDRARFYIAELVLALEHLHKYDIVYRDLKPENILLDATGHIALCDFGLSKADLPSDQLTNTFCGTTEYLAPEVLLDDHGYSKLVDFWSLGVLLFEMCCGWSPFYDEDTQQMYKNICFGKIKFPRNVINEDGKQFVKGLLNRNPKHRLGSQRDAQELKEHPFFKCIDWKALALKQITPPFIPEVESDESVANFDPEFTGMSMEDMGVLEDSDFDENDPSEAWVESASLSSGHHTPNGPLGSDLTFTSMNGTASGTRTPVETKPKKKKKPPKEPSLSSSVQENFKGFSYTGESLANSVLLAAMHRERVDEEEDEDEEDTRPRRTTDDEFDDDSKVAGRYSRGRQHDVEME